MPACALTGSPRLPPAVPGSAAVRLRFGYPPGPTLPGHTRPTDWRSDGSGAGAIHTVHGTHPLLLCNHYSMGAGGCQAKLCRFLKNVVLHKRKRDKMYKVPNRRISLNSGTPAQAVSLTREGGKRRFRSVSAAASHVGGGAGGERAGRSGRKPDGKRNDP